MSIDFGFADEIGEPSLKRKYLREELQPLAYTPKQHRYLTTDEIDALPSGDVIVMDTETYSNYFLIQFKHLKSSGIFYMERDEENNKVVDTIALQSVLFRFQIITFNGKAYDFPLIVKVLSDATNDEIKAKSDEIIHGERGYTIDTSGRYNHVDLIEVAPLLGSLKLYAARLHCERMQELPIHPDKRLTEHEKWIVRDYGFNDLDNTELLYNELKPQILLREQLSRDYKQDVRSRSDAQLAETVINSELERITGNRPKKPSLDEGYSFSYSIPSYIKYNDANLQSITSILERTRFKLDNNGAPILPEAIANLNIRIGQSNYRMGIGGLHSTEQEQGIKAIDNLLLLDRDVASYYPMIVLNQGLYPQHLGESFLEVYRKLVDRRLAAKAAGDKVAADSIKISINGSFGKLGNYYSTLYAPDLLLQVTITGQLALLMQIERIENAGISVVSANTDGIVIACPTSDYERLGAVIRGWEEDTGFTTEETKYSAIYSRDVNNYIAVKPDGTCKVKGVYSEKGSALNSVLSKNPECLIVSDAVQAFVGKGISIEQTIQSCRDIRRFVSVRNVKGGAHKDGVYVGKVIRWYYSTQVRGEINYVNNGNKVPKSDNACPYMQLGDFPLDLDFNYYITQANEMLFDIGFYHRPRQISFF